MVTWNIAFYGLTFIAFILIGVLLYLPSPFYSGGNLTLVVIWFISLLIGYSFGFIKGRDGGSKLENKHLAEIKKLLIKRKSLNLVDEKIQKWKEEGYNVSELETMIEDIK